MDIRELDMPIKIKMSLLRVGITDTDELVKAAQSVGGIERLNLYSIDFNGYKRFISNIGKKYKVALMEALRKANIEIPTHNPYGLVAAEQSVQADVLESPACCASFVAYGVHHEDCRNNPARR